MRGAHHCLGLPVSEMTYTVSSVTLNSTIPYHAGEYSNYTVWYASFIEITHNIDFFFGI